MSIVDITFKIGFIFGLFFLVLFIVWLGDSIWFKIFKEKRTQE